MKLLILILILILVFALCYIMYEETSISIGRLPWKNTQYENLQNMDASFLSYGDSDEYPSASSSEWFYNKVMDENDTDLSGLFKPGTYNSTFFRDNSDNIYDISGIEKDIKYFNNVSHILADYYSKNMIIDETS